MRMLLLVALLCVGTILMAQDKTTFILVRHAEKANDGSKNPPLSEAGVERANRLLDLLSEAEITAIYSTNYDRTLQTVAPLAAEKELNVENYEWDDPKTLLKSIIKKYPSGIVVISGHSNTTPMLANILLGGEKLEMFDDSDYGNILVVSASKLGNGQLMHLRF